MPLLHLNYNVLQISQFPSCKLSVTGKLFSNGKVFLNPYVENKFEEIGYAKLCIMKYMWHLRILCSWDDNLYSLSLHRWDPLNSFLI